MIKLNLSVSAQKTLKGMQKSDNPRVKEQGIKIAQQIGDFITTSKKVPADGQITVGLLNIGGRKNLMWNPKPETALDTLDKHVSGLSNKFKEILRSWIE